MKFLPQAWFVNLLAVTVSINKKRRKVTNLPPILFGIMLKGVCRGDKGI